MATMSAIGEAINILTGRALTDSNKPIFSVTQESQISNVTGDGTVYTIPLSTVNVNQTSAYNTGTGVFTAAVSGKYYFAGAVYVIFTETATLTKLYFTASNRTVSNGYYLVGSSGDTRFHATAFIDMDAADTVSFQVSVAGGGKTADITYPDYRTTSNFSGYLVC
jgi:hypothetical protein